MNYSDKRSSLNVNKSNTDFIGFFFLIVEEITIKTRDPDALFTVICEICSFC